MISSIYTADVKLYTTDKNYHKYIIIQNDNGILMINKGLCSILFDDEEAILSTKIEVKNKKHIIDITV